MHVVGRGTLDVLFVSQWPPSPAALGAQRRVEGLMVALARRHRVSCISLVGPRFDAQAAERAMRAYCDEIVLVPSRADVGIGKRLRQLRSLASFQSYERREFALLGLRRELDNLLRSRRFDVVSIEGLPLVHHRVRQAPPGAPVPRVLLDEHNVEFDLARQSVDASDGVLRRLHHAVNWRKIKSEEVAAWRAADGVAFTSANDLSRARALVPALRATVIPNGVDIDRFRPGPHLPPCDGRTVLFFGTLNYFPNQDAVLQFLRETWPLLERSNPSAKLKIVGPYPTPQVLAYQGPKIEVTGLVDDVRPHLSAAACVIAPLRVGGGTRFKIIEAMALARPVISTTIGAEGIGTTAGRDILIAEEPEAFAVAIDRVLHDPRLAHRLGTAARQLVEERYGWNAVATDLEAFLRRLLEEGPPRRAPAS